MRSALFRAAAALLPDGRETLLLRTLTSTGASATRAWSELESGADDIRDRMEADPGGLERLAPYLFRRLEAEGCAVDPRTARYLGTAYEHGRRRQQHYEETAHTVLTALRQAGVEPLVLQGAALGPWLYEETCLRPGADLKLLLSEVDLAKGRRALEVAGLRQVAGRGRPSWAVCLAGPGGLPVRLRSRLFRQRTLRAREGDVRDRSQPVEIAGVQARTASGEDHLVHVLGHAAFHRSRRSLLWACDATLLVRRVPELDWSYVEDAAAHARTIISAYVMLRYLRDRLQVPVPSRALSYLYARAWDTGPLGRDLTLYAARSAAGGVSSFLRTQEGWSDRLALLRLTAFPSAPYLRQAAGFSKTWPPMAARVVRPVRRSLVRRRARRAQHGRPSEARPNLVFGDFHETQRDNVRASTASLVS